MFEELASWLADHVIARIILTAIAAHLIVLLLGKLSESRIFRRISRSTDKSRTILGLLHSLAAFIIYFIALGYILDAIGIDLGAYLASASVIALAVGFGSQGVVQDVVTGVTLVFADLFDVGEMVEIAGQAGIVRRVGMRFTVIQNYMGALVYIPNRSIANVINFPDGFVRVLVDVKLHGERPAQIRTAAVAAIDDVWRRYPRLVLRQPREAAVHGSSELVRFIVMVWPGQNPLVETILKNTLLPRIKTVEPDYPDTGLVLGWEADAMRLVATDHQQRRAERAQDSD